MIAVIDYDAGNMFSVRNALDYLGFESMQAGKPADLENADKLILPGVGAFPDAMRSLREGGLADAIIEEAKIKPLLGICLGAQLLFEKGYEFEATEGLGLIGGYVDAIAAPGLKIPHMGWNDVRVVNQSPLSESVKDGDMVYFVHSYKAVTDEKNISLATTYGQLIPALVRGGAQGNVYGAQFHPEKSGSVGLAILKNFAAL
ncbi:MAG: imidazole glycerol phosphate synthase subunit HisH [Clostridiales Family XIII bacterium]|jgi:glutamine amidotransferase|nr:imidazole glycerol phosphate synthase subunit HisH [Clostridiales Family XIII bacterium]